VSDNPVVDMLARIDERLGGIDNRLARVDHRLGGLEKGQATLEKGQTSLRLDLMARMDGMSDQITVVKDDMGVTTGSSDSVRKAGDATKKEPRALTIIQPTLARAQAACRSALSRLLDDPSREPPPHPHQSQQPHAQHCQRRRLRHRRRKRRLAHAAVHRRELRPLQRCVGFAPW